jgi:predicted XRE-type DNA-binding protein
MPKKDYAVPAANVFHGLGDRNSSVDDHFVKAQLVFKINALLKARSLKQVEAASLFGIRQPDVSKLLRGDMRQFSMERLLRFLVALDQDVEISVKPHRDSKKTPALQVF